MKKSIEPNERLVKKEVRFLNVVLYPESRQSPRRYAELFAKVFDLKIAVNTFAEKITQIESYEVDKDFCYGRLVNFTDLQGKKWFDRELNVVEDFEFTLKKYPNAKEKDFYFLPSIHKIAIIGRESPSLGQVQKFFQLALSKVVDHEFDESVEVNIVTDSILLDKIYSSAKLVSLELHVSYSNNDVNEDYEAAIDEELKDQEVRKMHSTFSGTFKNPLKIKKKSLIGGILSLTRNNGYAIAKGEFDGEYQTVSTQNYPQSCKLVTTEKNLKSELKKKMLSFFGRNG